MSNYSTYTVEKAKALRRAIEDGETMDEIDRLTTELILEMPAGIIGPKCLETKQLLLYLITLVIAPR